MEEKSWSPETVTFISQHADDDVKTLALQALRHPGVDMPEAVAQIAARQTARQKLPTWWRTEGIRYPHHLSMEQCSSELTARYKASLIPPRLRKGLLTDLSGGFGVDFCCMAKEFSEAIYVERQEGLCRLARHNLPLLGLEKARVVNDDSADYLRQMEPCNVIFVDPARRNRQGGRTVAISDCEPDVASLGSLLLEKSRLVIVKLSPMLDISRALTEMASVCEVHVVAVDNECKELLLVLMPGCTSERAAIICTNLDSREQEEREPFRFSLTDEAASDCPMAEHVMTYLYEPNAALMKAGAFRSLAQRYRLAKLHPNSHLYTSRQLLPDFPGRQFEVKACGGFGKKELRELHEQVPRANLTVRNFPATVAELRKRLKLADGGEEYLFATTLANGNRCWIRCKKIKKEL